MIEYQSI